MKRIKRLSWVWGLFLISQTVAQNISITNIYDAFGKENEKLVQSFGFSCLIKYNGKTILFDAGSNADIFKKNLAALGFDPGSIDIVVVSHSHFDHLNGLDYLLSVNKKVKIYFPYDIFWGAPSPFDATGQESNIKDSLPVEMRYFEGKETKFVINQTGRFWNANIEYIKASIEIIPGARLVVNTSAYMGYFNKYPNLSFVPELFKNNTAKSNESGLVELSLSLDGRDGQVLVVGCSHSGVENIILNAKNGNSKNIGLVYGGFHLLPYKREELHQLIQYIQGDLSVKKVAPAHCTGHLGFKLFKEAFRENYLFAGLGETIRIN
jgi:7,8-dihydropterin-6-yl-methyl-4-(beta-D-ribofuranosyl)aminobenzene 5'-phosphate synthase